MKPLIQLNLDTDIEKTEKANLPEREEPESDEVRKRLDQMANRVAHKGARQYGRNTSSIFSK